MAVEETPMAVAPKQQLTQVKGVESQAKLGIGGSLAQDAATMINMLKDAKSHFQATTTTYATWNTKKYPVGVKETTQWYLGLDGIDQVIKALGGKP